MSDLTPIMKTVVFREALTSPADHKRYVASVTVTSQMIVNEDTAKYRDAMRRECEILIHNELYGPIRDELIEFSMALQVATAHDEKIREWMESIIDRLRP